MNYKEMNLSEKMKKSLEKMGYETPTEIQEKSIPQALLGHDIVGQAQTGTGKTAAFSIPIIENTDVENSDIQHLILSPTRELASQIMNEIKKLGAEHNVNVIQIIGGISYERQREKLKTKPQIIVGTPGRIKDYLEQGKLKIHNIKSFALDEVDQLLSIGFQKDIEYINSKLPSKKQNFFFSATFDKKVSALANKMLKDPVNVSVSSGLKSTETVEQKWIISKDKNKFALLKLFLQIHNPVGAIIFCRTKKGVDNLVTDLKKAGFKADGIQGDMDQNIRSRVIRNFRNQVFNIVVGTDVLARGIDVGHADIVYNYDLPEEVENYTHRIGRVGRAGREGFSLSFVKPSQKGYIQRILRETNSKKAEEIQIPSQEEVDKLFALQRDKVLEEYLGRKNKQQFAPMLLEKYSAEDLAAILSVFIKRKVKTVNVTELINDEATRDRGMSNSSKRSRNNRRAREGQKSSRDRSRSSRDGGKKSYGNKSNSGRPNKRNYNKK